jgi:outer membrane protein
MNLEWRLLILIIDYCYHHRSIVMKKVILGALLIASIPNLAAATTLQEVLVHTYNTNPTILAGRANLRATDEAYANALSGWLPSASATGERNRQSVSAGTAPTVTSNGTAYDLTVTQPLFNGGGTIAQMRRAKNLIEAERATLKRTEQTVFLNAITAYMEVISSEETLKLTQKNLANLKKNLQSTQLRFKLGEVTNTDVAQANSRLSRSITAERRALSDTVVARGNFKAITGMDPLQLTPPQEAVIKPATLDEAINLAAVKNPNTSIAKYTMLAVQNEVSANKATLLPTVNVRANARRTDGFINLGGAEYDTDTISLNATIPLYQSGAEYARIRESKSRLESRKFDTESVTRDVLRSTTRSWEAFHVARATLQSSKDSADAASIALSGVMQEAEYGSRTVLDVLNAEQELVTAQIDLVRAKQEEIVGSYSLKAALGELTAEDLKLPVKYYNPELHFNKTKYRIIGF